MYTKRISLVMFSLVLGVFLGAVAPADITTGLVGYWPLDGDAQDASGNDLHGTISKVTPAPDRLSYADSAMSFTGAADSSSAAQTAHGCGALGRRSGHDSATGSRVTQLGLRRATESRSAR